MTDLVLWDLVGTLWINGKLNPDATFGSGLNCIVSNYNNKDEVIVWCQNVGIAEVFLPNQIVCGDDVIRKPDIRIYLKLLNQLGPLKVSSLTVIGDSDTDLYFAQNLGTKFVHINELKV